MRSSRGMALWRFALLGPVEGLHDWRGSVIWMEKCGAKQLFVRRQGQDKNAKLWNVEGPRSAAASLRTESCFPPT